MAEKYRIKLKDNLLTGVSTREREKLAETTKNLYILRELAKSKSYKVRSNLAKNPNTPVDILRELAEDNSDENWKVRSNLAKNPNTPVEVLKQLIEDDSVLVREYVVANPNCPVDILKKFGKDENENVRWCVAENTSCPVDVLRKLAEDIDWGVRGRVASNPNTPVDILKQLAEDEKEYVRDYAKSNPTFKKYVKTLNIGKLDEIDYMSDNDKLELAKTTKDLDILKELAKKEGNYVLLGVAKNPNCPGDILRKLAKSEDWLRWRIASNPNTPEDVLKDLAEDKDKIVRRNAKNNPNYGSRVKQQPELSSLSPSQIRTRIFKGSKESRIEALKYALDNIERFDNSLFELVAELNVPYLNEVLETHPNTPDELFEE